MFGCNAAEVLCISAKHLLHCMKDKEGWPGVEYMSIPFYGEFSIFISTPDIQKTPTNQTESWGDSAEVKECIGSKFSVENVHEVRALTVV